MSVLITMKIHGDLETFDRAMAERGDEFVRVAERAKSLGALHHRFARGDGFVVAVDEWQSADDFEKFFGDPDMHAFIGSVGGDLSTPPDITVGEALESPDQF